MEKYSLVGSSTCKEVLEKYPDYKVFWHGKCIVKNGKALEDDKQPHQIYDYKDGQFKTMTFEERMQQRYNYYATFSILINKDMKSIIVEGLNSKNLN